MTNLELWESVEKTDKAHTTKIVGKNYQGTSPKPYYLIKKATETFGPCGIGWGIKILDQRIEAGSGDDRLHIAHILLWYIWDGERGEVEHVGQTMFSGRRKPKGNEPGEIYLDEDAPKKSVTDALVKALSMLGFAGDIFMGQFGDDKYTDNKEEQGQRLQPKSRATAPAKQQTADAAIADYVELCLRVIPTYQSQGALKDWWLAQKNMRDSLTIVNGTKEYTLLYNTFMARGKALSEPRRLHAVV